MGPFWRLSSEQKPIALEQLNASASVCWKASKLIAATIQGITYVAVLTVVNAAAKTINYINTKCALDHIYTTDGGVLKCGAHYALLLDLSFILDLDCMFSMSPCGDLALFDTHVTGAVRN